MRFGLAAVLARRRAGITAPAPTSSILRDESVSATLAAHHWTAQTPSPRPKAPARLRDEMSLPMTARIFEDMVAV
jgi:hypothetical protein